MGNQANQKKVWIAQQKKIDEERRQKEAIKEFEKEQSVFTNREFLRDKKKGQEGKPLGFLYAPPPGYVPPEKREKEKEEGQKDKQPAKLKLEEKFGFLKNAPREGSYASDLPVHHRPLGIEIR